jgi:putative PIG3 family NAD(P)H quinone oxidoreductase
MSDRMKAIVIREPGGPEVLELREVERPRPGAGELLVRVAASGINRADLLQRVGKYPVPTGYPESIPGLEYAGVVEEVCEGAGGTEGVCGFAPGDLVMGITGGGAYAEYVREPAATVVRVPGRVRSGGDEVVSGTVAAGAIPEAFMTAFDAVFLQEGLREGETLLIHAVGSGVGTAALQLAVRAGARVIGTSRTAEKLVRAGALGLEDGVLTSVGAGAESGASWPDRVLELTDGRGAELILDLVGGPYLEGNQRVLASRGRHVVVGVPGGARAEIDLRALMGRRGSIRGTVLRARPIEEKAALARAFEERVLPGFEDGSLVPVVDRVFEPARAAEAHAYMESNANFGKILLGW